MKQTKLVIIGGFLGAGKTTFILNIAKKLLSDNKKVGIVTNDQGSQLVDTNFLAKSGLPVLEVAGGCFCCNFDDFVDRINNLAENEMPDIILAEPVGSCADLIATIFKPLMMSYTGKFSLSPLSIIVDPKRAKKLMHSVSSAEFPDEINYLFEKQLEEADIIFLNKIDTLKNDDINSMCDYFKERFKGATIMPISAKNDIGICIPMLIGFEMNDKTPLDINYNTYAQAEEFLGWLNSSVLIKTKVPIDFNKYITDLLDDIREDMRQENSEIAHLKVYAVSKDDYTKASITSLDDEIDFSKKLRDVTDNINLIINARINIDPDLLNECVKRALDNAAAKWDAEIDELKTESFKPKRPKPKYRMIN